MARKSRIIGDTEARVPAVKGICKAGIYARVSSENSGEDTLETQVYFLKSFVEEQEDMVLAETYSDFGFTGTNFERPGFGRMMEDKAVMASLIESAKVMGEDRLEVAWKYGDVYEKILGEMQ